MFTPDKEHLYIRITKKIKSTEQSKNYKPASNIETNILNKSIPLVSQKIRSSLKNISIFTPFLYI